MVKQLFVNLGIKDLNKTVDFFTKLGFTFNKDFTDETATCMIISENIFAMLITEAKFKEFAPNPPSDPKKNTEVLLALSVENRSQVDEMVQKAVSAGGNTFNEAQDHGFMYAHSFQDLDGHVWEVFAMEGTPPK
ncbi:VOC family protein [Leptospira sarikeiensis]|uniref:Glyoxalase/bleomycin resistance/extradiol dioxygenase family protein n=1 Tax=Leptospira sarikeiensis TaxID=2484943 RepID=A0A4R9KD03_9LEPT|nr:VOC family protein [Leptospira sarikeiensis]TGL64006.1 glyoxalase/bleomycin resistance/extradiol dioxygenase family protein [Leptospira sarikeiensis]